MNARARHRGTLLALLLIAVAIFSAGLGLKDPWPADAPRFALIAQEMVVTGQWLIPHRAGEPYSHKPPLFLWAVAAFYAVTGSIRLAHLLPSILAGLGIMLLTWDLARRLWGERIALWSMGALLFTVQFSLQARTGQIDALLCLWTTLGLYGLCRHLLLGPSWRWALVGSLAMGCGVITKGVGFLPVLVLVPWFWVSWRGWHHLPATKGSMRGTVIGAGLCVLALLVPIVAWLVPMWLATAQDPALLAYRNDLLFGQTAGRYAHASGHLRPWWFFIGNRLWTLWFPLSFALPWLLPAWWRRLRRRDARYALLLGWVALVLLFFSLSSGKRGVYILPALPALALAAGPLLPGLLRRRNAQRLAFAAVLLPAAVLLSVLVIHFTVAPPWTTEALHDHGAKLFVVLAVVTALAWGWVLAAKLLPSSRLLPSSQRGLLALGGFLTSAWVVAGWGIEPLLNDQRSGRGMMEKLARHLPAQAELGMLGWREQLVLQADRRVTHFGFAYTPAGDPDARFRHRAAAWLESAPDRRLFIASDWLAPCFVEARAEVVEERAHRQRWLLVSADAITSACRTTAAQRAKQLAQGVYQSVGPPVGNGR